MPFDFKKEYKEFYLPKEKPEIVTVPPANYIAVRGTGDPNEESGSYQQAIGVLYAVAYTLKMSYKTDYCIEGFYDYVVPHSRGSGGRMTSMVLIMPTSLLSAGFRSSDCRISSPWRTSNGQSILQRKKRRSTALRLSSSQ